MSTKIAPRLRARAIRKLKSLKTFKNWHVRNTFGKSKSLKTGRLGALLEVELRKICATPARAIDLEVKIVKNYPPGAGVREGCKNVGRRGGFEEGLKRCVSHGRGKDFVLCDVDGWGLRRRIRGRVANFMSRKCYFAVIISRGSYRSSYASAQLFCGKGNTFEAST